MLAWYKLTVVDSSLIHSEAYDLTSHRLVSVLVPHLKCTVPSPVETYLQPLGGNQRQ